jgi:hypothetical protein
MDYFIKRGEEKFGPYSLSDLQLHVQSGNIAPDDLAQSEGMADWAPVAQVLGTIPAPVAFAPGAMAAVPAVPTVPLPPNLHWGFVFLFGALTRQLFNMIWALVQANWARKLINDNKPMVLVAMYPAGIIGGIIAIAAGRRHQASAAIGTVLIFAGVITYIIGIFNIKHAMEDYYNSTENIGLKLSGGMTFFFSTCYLQYHINRIARWKKTGTLS